MKMILAIGIVILAIWLLLSNERETPAPPRPVATPAPTFTPAWTPAATPFVPAAQMPRPTPDTRLQRMQALAGQSGVQFRGLQPEGNGAWLTVSWIGDQTTVGMDYIVVLMREKLVRDFDVNRKSLNATVRDGRRVWVGRYFVYL